MSIYSKDEVAPWLGSLTSHLLTTQYLKNDRKVKIEDQFHCIVLFCLEFLLII